MRPASAAIFVLALAALLAACDAPANARRRTGTSKPQGLIALMAPPPQEEAVSLARNPYSANDRFRGTSLLAGAPYGAEPEHIQIYLDNAGDADPGVRAASLRALGLHGEAEHAPLLVQRLSDPDTTVRVEAARALQRIHAPATAAVGALIERLSADVEPEARVRFESARALAQHRENRVVEALISALSDDDFIVTDAAAGSLRTLTGQDLSSDSRVWQAWYQSTDSVFAAGSGYTYPVFKRGKYLWEYLPFLPQPPNETATMPVGMSPSIQ